MAQKSCPRLRICRAERSSGRSFREGSTIFGPKTKLKQREKFHYERSLIASMNEYYIKRENVLNAGVLKQNPTTDVEKNLIYF